MGSILQVIIESYSYMSYTIKKWFCVYTLTNLPKVDMPTSS